jgi:hypothetical protein
MTRRHHIGLITGAALLATISAHAENIYQEPGEFIAAAFDGQTPQAKALWINDEMRAASQRILGRTLRKLRMRYWQQDQRSVWILDEIGKDLPITTGIVVEDGSIRSVQVLIFRESRGWQVRYPFFTDQFVGAGLATDKQLDRSIDNISGATLSVNALKRQAQLALLLSTYTN